LNIYKQYLFQKIKKCNNVLGNNYLSIIWLHFAGHSGRAV